MAKSMKLGRRKQRASEQPVQRFAVAGTPKGSLATNDERPVYDHTIRRDGSTTPDVKVNPAGS